MDIRLKSFIFKPSDPISVLVSVRILMTTCDSNGAHDGATMRIFCCFVKEPAKVVLSY